MTNVGIRVAILTAGLKQYMVADEMGLSEQYFSQLMRHELPPEKQAEILAAIDRLKTKLQGASIEATVSTDKKEGN